MPNILLSLSDSDKRLIFSLLLIVIVILVLIALLGFILVKVMKWQAKKMDTLIHDVVVYKVITDKKALMKYGRAKNWAYFFKQAYIPLLIIIFGIIMLIIRCSIANDWNYHFFSTQNGFGTIFWTWKASGTFSGTDYDLIRFQQIIKETKKCLKKASMVLTKQRLLNKKKQNLRNNYFPWISKIIWITI